MALAGAQEHAVQIAAMHHRIGVAEARAKRVAQIDMGDFLRRQRIHQPELVDIDRHAARGFADAEIIKGMKRVGTELDAGADFAERGSLLQQDGAKTLLREAQGCRKAANAAAGDQHRPFARGPHQPDFPRCSSASSARSGTREASLLRSTSCANSAVRVLLSAGLSGCSIRACARSTEGMMLRNSVAPGLVR